VFRKKTKPEPEVSALDSLPDGVKAKIIGDVVAICQTLKAWPDLLTPQQQAAVTSELRAVFTKVGGKLASAFIKGHDLDTAFPEILKISAIPEVVKQSVKAVSEALE
jgi:hypothetical protein